MTRKKTAATLNPRAKTGDRAATTGGAEPAAGEQAPLPAAAPRPGALGIEPAAPPLPAGVTVGDQAADVTQCPRCKLRFPPEPAPPVKHYRIDAPPACPIHKQAMVADHSGPLKTFYSCPTPGCNHRDMAARPGVLDRGGEDFAAR